MSRVRASRWAVGGICAVAAVAFLLPHAGWPASGTALAQGTAAADVQVTAAADTQRTGIDELLGGVGRRLHAQRLAELKVDGQIYPWDRYARWGEQLFFTGQVQEPPGGDGPSTRLSRYYTCVDCHNAEREDPVLSCQSPTARATYLAERNRGRTGKRPPLKLATGTTMWGVVNRESFYNGSYGYYHWLEVPDPVTGELRPMDPKSLYDATQTCTRYCSIGRWGEPWEIAALLTWFWELEVRLEDLDLPDAVADAVGRSLRNTADTENALKARAFVRRQILTAAGETFCAPPADSGDDGSAEYADRLLFVGDPSYGERLYAMACQGCHGKGKVSSSAGADLVGDLEYFHDMIAHGTEQDETAYMPKFTAERLDRQQIADIRAYLLTLAEE